MTEQLYRVCWRSYEQCRTRQTFAFCGGPNVISWCYRALLSLRENDARTGGYADYWLEPL